MITCDKILQAKKIFLSLFLLTLGLFVVLLNLYFAVFSFSKLFADGI